MLRAATSLEAGVAAAGLLLLLLLSAHAPGACFVCVEGGGELNDTSVSH